MGLSSQMATCFVSKWEVPERVSEQPSVYTKPVPGAKKVGDHCFEAGHWVSSHTGENVYRLVNLRRQVPGSQSERRLPQEALSTDLEEEL